MQFIQSLLTRLTLNEAAAEQSVTDNPKKIAKLTKSAIKMLKSSTEDDVSTLSMAVVKRRIRAFVESELQTDDVTAKLTPKAISIVVSLVLDNIQKNAVKYGLAGTNSIKEDDGDDSIEEDDDSIEEDDKKTRPLEGKKPKKGNESSEGVKQ